MSETPKFERPVTFAPPEGSAAETPVEAAPSPAIETAASTGGIPQFQAPVEPLAMVAAEEKIVPQAETVQAESFVGDAPLHVPQIAEMPAGQIATAFGFSRYQLLALVGCILLLGSLFLPVVTYRMPAHTHWNGSVAEASRAINISGFGAVIGQNIDISWGEFRIPQSLNMGVALFVPLVALAAAVLFAKRSKKFILGVAVIGAYGSLIALLDASNSFGGFLQSITGSFDGRAPSLGIGVILHLVLWLGIVTLCVLDIKGVAFGKRAQQEALAIGMIGIDAPIDVGTTAQCQACGGWNLSAFTMCSQCGQPL
ncbi:MAG: hypothetical protein FWE06_01985 [Oscillospiraceae bacterium]|nr:hypothetical protein [Oscillospiraceae bacterium]